jgi:CRP/FNR family transcriptional regulator, dissimilatory nitrate respiration regulator
MIAVMSDNFFDLPATERVLRKGRYLFHQSDAVQHMFQIVESEVQLIRRDKQGHKLILQRGGQGNILAEASLFTNTYHCDAVAVEVSGVRCFSRNDVLKRFESDPIFTKQWATHLASEVRTARFKAEVLSQRTVAQHLDMWLLQNGVLPDKGTWKQLAAEIGTSPEALYREIAKKRER